jgi:signal transduction histidine kinase
MTSVALRFLKSGAKRYFIAASTALVALAVQGLLTLLLGDHSPYHTLWVALVLSAWYCGVGPSIVALTIGLLGVWYWFVPPPHSFVLPNQSDMYGMFVFVFFSAFIIALGESHRRETAKRLQVEQELRITKTELEDRVHKRTAELNAANTSLRELPGHLLKMQDQERRRIARELHDTTGQSLTALKMIVTSLRGAIINNQRAVQFVQEINDLIDQTITEIRTTSYLLHPPLLDEMGLISAINWYVDGFSQRSGVKVSLELPQSSSRLPENIELALFRVLQESLTNVHRHSGCSAVTIHFEMDNERLRLSVKDNGRGIPQDRIRRFGEHGTGFGVGIVGMRERLRELGGQLTIESDGSGTTLMATVPLKVGMLELTQAGIARSASAGH